MDTRRSLPSTLSRMAYDPCPSGAWLESCPEIEFEVSRGNRQMLLAWLGSLWSFTEETIGFESA